MATLYEMKEQAKQLYELLQEEEIDEQTYSDTLEAIGIEEKLEAYCQVLKQLQADSEMFKAEKQRIEKNKKTADNGIKRLKTAMFEYLKVTNQEKAKAGTFSVAISKSKSVNILDVDLIPEQFKTEQEPKIDKIAIKEAIKNGQNVAGAEIIENEGVRVR